MLDAEQGTDDFKRSLEDQQAKLRREADLLRYRLAKIDSALALIDGGGRAAFTLVDAPDQLYVSASVGRDFGVSVENEREIALFYDLLSITSCARIIAKRDFDAPGETVDPSYVIAMPESEEHRLEGVDRAHVGRLCLGKCVRFRRRVTRAGEHAQGDVRGPVRLPGRPRLRAAGGRDPVPVVSEPGRERQRYRDAVRPGEIKAPRRWRERRRRGGRRRPRRRGGCAAGNRSELVKPYALSAATASSAAM